MRSTLAWDRSHVSESTWVFVPDIPEGNEDTVPALASSMDLATNAGGEAGLESSFLAVDRSPSGKVSGLRNQVGLSSFVMLVGSGDPCSFSE
jgi:hypothetical protein